MKSVVDVIIQCLKILIIARKSLYIVLNKAKINFHFMANILISVGKHIVAVFSLCRKKLNAVCFSCTAPFKQILFSPKGLENRPKKKDGNLNHGLIDVDLVRGSAFTKAKPQHHWSAVLRKGIQRVLLFPCYTSWWQQHTSKHVTSLLFLVYVMQITQLVLILCYDKVFEEVSILYFLKVSFHDSVINGGSNV